MLHLIAHKLFTWNLLTVFLNISAEGTFLQPNEVTCCESEDYV